MQPVRLLNPDLFLSSFSYYRSSLPFQDANSQHVVSSHISYFKKGKEKLFIACGQDGHSCVIRLKNIGKDVLSYYWSGVFFFHDVKIRVTRND